MTWCDVKGVLRRDLWTTRDHGIVKAPATTPLATTEAFILSCFVAFRKNAISDPSSIAVDAVSRLGLPNMGLEQLPLPRYLSALNFSRHSELDKGRGDAT